VKKIFLILFLFSVSLGVKAEEKNRGYLYIREGLKVDDLIVKKDISKSDKKTAKKAQVVAKTQRQNKIRSEKKALDSRREITRVIRKEEYIERKEESKLECLKRAYGEEMGPVMLEGEKNRESSWEEAKKEFEKIRAVAR